MNFDEAISSHTAWKMKLSRYLSKPDGSLNAAAAQSANQCELGKWIDREGAKYAKLPEFVALVSGHASFHKAAADIIRRADAGQKVAEEVALGARSEFAAASSSVVRSIMSMRLKA